MFPRRRLRPVSALDILPNTFTGVPFLETTCLILASKPPVLGNWEVLVNSGLPEESGMHPSLGAMNWISMEKPPRILAVSALQRVSLITLTSASILS